MTTRVVRSLADVDGAQWNALAAGAEPFLRHEFLLALEESGCAVPDTGWDAHHLLHFARIAYNKEASEAFGNFTGLDPLNLPKREAAHVSLAVDNSTDSELRKELRRIILEELKAVLAA